MQESLAEKMGRAMVTLADDIELKRLLFDEYRKHTEGVKSFGSIKMLSFRDGSMMLIHGQVAYTASSELTQGAYILAFQGVNPEFDNHVKPVVTAVEAFLHSQPNLEEAFSRHVTEIRKSIRARAENESN